MIILRVCNTKCNTNKCKPFKIKALKGYMMGSIPVTRSFWLSYLVTAFLISYNFLYTHQSI